MAKISQALLTERRRELEWRAKDDARTLADAENIRTDQVRLKRAQKQADKMAKDREKEALAMKKIARPMNEKKVNKSVKKKKGTKQR